MKPALVRRAGALLIEKSMPSSRTAPDLTFSSNDAAYASSNARTWRLAATSVSTCERLTLSKSGPRRSKASSAVRGERASLSTETMFDSTAEAMAESKAAVKACAASARKRGAKARLRCAPATAAAGIQSKDESVRRETSTSLSSAALSTVAQARAAGSFGPSPGSETLSPCVFAARVASSARTTALERMPARCARTDAV